MRYQGKNYTKNSYSRASAETQKTVLKLNEVTTIRIPVRRLRNEPSVPFPKNVIPANAKKNKIRLANFRVLVLLIILLAAVGSVIFIFIYLSGPSARVVEKLSLFACTGITSVATIAFDNLGIKLGKGRKKKSIIKKVVACFVAVILFNGAVYAASVIKAEYTELPPSPPQQPSVPQPYNIKSYLFAGRGQHVFEIANGIITVLHGEAPQDEPTDKLLNDSTYSVHTELANNIYDPALEEYLKSEHQYQTGQISDRVWKNALEEWILSLEKAIAEGEKATKTLRYDVDLYLIAIRYRDMGDAYIKLKRYDDALNAFILAIEFSAEALLTKVALNGRSHISPEKIINEIITNYERILTLDNILRHHDEMEIMLMKNIVEAYKDIASRSDQIYSKAA